MLKGKTEDECNKKQGSVGVERGDNIFPDIKNCLRLRRRRLPLKAFPPVLYKRIFQIHSLEVSSRRNNHNREGTLKYGDSALLEKTVAPIPRKMFLLGSNNLPHPEIEFYSDFLSRVGVLKGWCWSKIPKQSTRTQSHGFSHEMAYELKTTLHISHSDGVTRTQRRRRVVLPQRGLEHNRVWVPRHARVVGLG